MIRALLATLLLVALPAFADEAQPEERAPEKTAPAPEQKPIGPWKPYRSQVAVVSAFPEGLDTQFEIGWKKELYATDALLFRDSYLALAIAPKVNPSFSRVGPAFEWQPIAVFRLSGGAEYVQFFSTFGNLQSYGSPRADYRDRVRAEHADQAYAASAFHATLEPLVQMKVGPIAARAKATAEFWDASLAKGDTVFYASSTDVLAPNRGWILTRTADVLYVPGNGVVAGLRYTETTPLYRDADYAEGERAVDNAHARAGFIAAFTPQTVRATRIGRPTFFLVGGWYLEHRYRTDGPNAVLPNLVGGVAFTFDSSK